MPGTGRARPANGAARFVTVGCSRSTSTAARIGRTQGRGAEIGASSTAGVSAGVEALATTVYGAGTANVAVSVRVEAGALVSTAVGAEVAAGYGTCGGSPGAPRGATPTLTPALCCRCIYRAASCGAYARRGALGSSSCLRLARRSLRWIGSVHALLRLME